MGALVSWTPQLCSVVGLLLGSALACCWVQPQPGTEKFTDVLRLGIVVPSIDEAGIAIITFQQCMQRVSLVLVKAARLGRVHICLVLCPSAVESLTTQ